jgi:site-specific recombinase XerD
MSAIHDALAEYLATRRALGTQLKWPESSLRKFVDFVEAEGAEFLTTDLAVRWACQAVGVQRATHARRLGIVRAFAVWLQATDPRTQVPPQGLLPARHHRPAPHIYSDGEIANLMVAASQLRSVSGLRGATFKTLIGLLAATGLRPGEALKLETLAKTPLQRNEGSGSWHGRSFGRSRVHLSCTITM